MGLLLLDVRFRGKRNGQFILFICRILSVFRDRCSLFHIITISSLRKMCVRAYHRHYIINTLLYTYIIRIFDMTYDRFSSVQVQPTFYASRDHKFSFLGFFWVHLYIQVYLFFVVYFTTLLC